MTKAAEQLGYSQPTITLQIQALELYRFSKRAETSLVCLGRRKEEPAIQTFMELVKDIWLSVREE